MSDHRTIPPEWAELARKAAASDALLEALALAMSALAIATQHRERTHIEARAIEKARAAVAKVKGGGP